MIKKNINIFAAGSSILLILYTLYGLIVGNKLFGLVPYGFFAIIFVFSIICLFQKKWIAITIQIVTLVVVIVLLPMVQTEMNFYVYKNDREKIISMLVNGEIKKKDGGNGTFFYPTPPQYKNAVKTQSIRAGMHSKDEYYVYFESVESPFWDMVGWQEGFIYSSTGKFPSPKKFDYYQEYKKIDDHWYYIAEDSDRFEKGCRFLCE
ncbi:hypothetical protein LCM00_15270 [Bacillus infantis]|uniref:hypothetical protein n=1 Tax=Bacillus infantis TaxID=324767 RepID=UPI001CD51DE8|nr:hypothetical protein [Bacillus infantis]MCA1040875.1 hypothetical protein [Bacillus infantis]